MNTDTGRAPIFQVTRITPHRMILLEGLILLLAAPFLLIPERVPPATLAALVALGAVWLLSSLTITHPATPFDVTFLMWSVVLIVGILVSADPDETLPKATNLILGLGVWRFLVLAIQTRRHLALATALYLFLGVAFSLIGILGSQEVPKIVFLGEINPFQGRTLPGLEGMSIHPNQLAGLICLYLPLLVSLTLVPIPGLHTRLSRVTLVVLTLLAAAILILTQSRGGWIGVSAGFFGLLCLWASILPQSGRRRSLRFLAAALVVAGLLLVVKIGPERLRDIWTDPPKVTAVGTLTTLNYRKELWPWAVTAVQDFPFTGVGLGAFRHVAFRLYPLALSPDQDIGHAHNIFIQTALDTGLPGLSVYLAVLFVAGAVGWQVAQREPAYRSLSLGLLAGLIAVHTFGLADALALGAKPGIIFWFGLGLLAAMNRVTSTPDRRD